MKMRRKCRLWWPNHLSTSEPASPIILFGWFISSSSTSQDIVVAFACDELSLSSVQSSLQGIIRAIGTSMPVSLQDKCAFSMIGHFAVDISRNGQLSSAGVAEDNQMNSCQGNADPESGHTMFVDKIGHWSCECDKLKGLVNHSKLVSAEKKSWVQLRYGSHGFSGRKIKLVPNLHHMHWDGQMVTEFDIHVVLYDTPIFGSHHFSVGFWNSERVRNHLANKPKWVQQLHGKHPILDMDGVVLAINSAHTANLLFKRHVFPEKAASEVSIISMCVTLIWKLLAISIASVSCLHYVLFQCLHILLSSGSRSWIYDLLVKVFRNTLKSIQIRRSQILYWPVLLKENGLRSQSCVEYAEKASLHKHSMWSSLSVDTLLGCLAAVTIFFLGESTCLRVSSSIHDATNLLLRTGCVWLMGVPAGFKLNTELAEVLGMISLNAIQIWSTLWFFTGSLFIYFVKGLAIVATLFGLTTAAALVMDVISLATLHVSTLHWMISQLYSQQTQAIAGLWRLFRGRKWNPLRQRYDSYDYTVEQHIVGSLLFMPLLLLLPTTSVFYIFFTIMKSIICFICLAIDIFISVIHATPYVKILLWLVRPKRFPSGLWFETWRSKTSTLEVGQLSDVGTAPEKSSTGKDTSPTQTEVLVSFLHSNLLNLGQILWPHYGCISSAASGSFFASLAYGVLTGRRVPSTQETPLRPTVPSMLIPCKEYWHICYGAVLPNKEDSAVQHIDQSNSS